MNAAALFTGEGVPLHDASMPVLDDLGTIICSRPICHVLFGLDDPDALQRGDVDLIYLLPMGSGPHQIASHHLAALVAILDQGGKVALHGPDEEAVAEAIGAVLTLAGGGRA